MLSHRRKSFRLSPQSHHDRRRSWDHIQSLWKGHSVRYRRDHKTGDSLNFAFVTLQQRKRQKRLISRWTTSHRWQRVHVDFSQSMHGLWKNYRRFGTKGELWQIVNKHTGVKKWIRNLTRAVKEGFKDPARMSLCVVIYASQRKRDG